MRNRSNRDLALRLIEKSIALDAGDESAHFEMGTVLDRLQRFADAAAEFARAVELAPADRGRALPPGARLRPHRQARSSRRPNARSTPNW